MPIKDKFADASKAAAGEISELRLTEINSEFVSQTEPRVTKKFSDYAEQANTGSAEISFSDMFGKSNFNTYTLHAGYIDCNHVFQYYSKNYYSDSATGFNPLTMQGKSKFNLRGSNYFDGDPGAPTGARGSLINKIGRLTVNGSRSTKHSNTKSARIPGEEHARLLAVSAKRFTTTAEKMPTGGYAGEIRKDAGWKGQDHHFFIDIQTLDRQPSTLSKPWSAVKVTGKFIYYDISSSGNVYSSSYEVREKSFIFKRDVADQYPDQRSIQSGYGAYVYRLQNHELDWRDYPLDSVEFGLNIDYNDPLIQDDLLIKKGTAIDGQSFPATPGTIKYGYDSSITNGYRQLEIDRASQYDDPYDSNYTFRGNVQYPGTLWRANPKEGSEFGQFVYQLHEGIIRYRWDGNHATFIADNGESFENYSFIDYYLFDGTGGSVDTNPHTGLKRDINGDPIIFDLTDHAYTIEFIEGE